MSFDLILQNLESGKISAQQAKDHIADLINDTKTCSSFTGTEDKIWQSGVNCVMIRFGMKEVICA